MMISLCTDEVINLSYLLSLFLRAAKAAVFKDNFRHFPPLDLEVDILCICRVMYSVFGVPLENAHD